MPLRSAIASAAAEATTYAALWPSASSLPIAPRRLSAVRDGRSPAASTAGAYAERSSPETYSATPSTSQMGVRPDVSGFIAVWTISCASVHWRSCSGIVA